VRELVLAFGDDLREALEHGRTRVGERVAPVRERRARARDRVCDGRVVGDRKASYPIAGSAGETLSSVALIAARPSLRVAA
jgi:hypothetical protein